MDVTPLIQSGQQVIQSYADGQFRVNDETYDSAVIVFPDEAQSWAFDGAVEDLSVEDFKPLLDKSSEIDVVLLGAGANMRFLPPALRAALKEGGLSVDIMDTGAACRTYNVLMAEGRRVVAALLPF